MDDGFTGSRNNAMIDETLMAVLKSNTQLTSWMTVTGVGRKLNMEDILGDKTQPNTNIIKVVGMEEADNINKTTYEQNKKVDYDKL